MLKETDNLLVLFLKNEGHSDIAVKQKGHQ